MLRATWLCIVCTLVVPCFAIEEETGESVRPWSISTPKNNQNISTTTAMVAGTGDAGEPDHSFTIAITAQGSATWIASNSGTSTGGTTPTWGASANAPMGGWTAGNHAFKLYKAGVESSIEERAIIFVNP